MLIRSRLLLLLLSVLLPAVIAAVFIITKTYSAERQANQRVLSDTARALSLVVDRELLQRASLIRGLSLSRALDAGAELSLEDLQAFEIQAHRTLQEVGGWLELRSEAALLLDTRYSIEETPRSIGTLSHSTRLEKAPKIQPLQAPASAAQGFYSTLIQPVKRSGKTVLNLSLTMLPIEFQRIIDHHQLPPDWVAAVLDTQGVVVARFPGGTAYTGRLATGDLRARMATSSEGLLQSITLDGLPVTSYFSTSTQGWTYVIGMPRAQFNGVLPNAVLQVALGGAALLALALVGAVWVSRSISRPVTSLMQAAARMQAGQAVQTHPTGIVECDEVQNALAQASRAMRHAQAELERQVAQAVKQTQAAEQRVSHSQRVEALGRLTGGVAHDFNNLLGVISNSAHLMQRHTQTPELLVPVAATLRAVEVGSRLTQHLLRFAGRQPVRPRSIDLAVYLPEVLELIRMVLGKRIEISVSVEPRTRPVTVDANELELALINLALNARDAITGNGHVWVHAVNAQAEDALGLRLGEYVLVTVADDGLGLDEKLTERVFEPFFSTKAVGQGTGLGLSQVHGFCTQAGGAARLASTRGVGTTVSMVLPVSPEQAVDEVVQKLPPLQDQQLAGVRVLLVEDNEDLGKVTAALLTSYGATVEHASGASEGLRRLQTAPPFDAVLSDVVMPGEMDGLALARHLRQHLPNLPVVLISGYSSELAQASEFTVLHKPCSPEQVVRALKNAIEQARVNSFLSS
jgi:signal transduction histidine kinase/ActR/RegA family two-component response regulator